VCRSGEHKAGDARGEAEEAKHLGEGDGAHVGTGSSTIPNATESKPPRPKSVRPPAVSPDLKAMSISPNPEITAQTPIQMVNAKR
jgi:hypothetical protein